MNLAAETTDMVFIIVDVDIFGMVDNKLKANAILDTIICKDGVLLAKVIGCDI